MDKGQQLLLFEEIWRKYPRREGKKQAIRHFLASVKTDLDYSNIQRALVNYLAIDTVKRGFIKLGSTWFNNWQDYIDYSGVQKDPEEEKLEQLRKMIAEKKGAH